jgi:hypothetical protein
MRLTCLLGGLTMFPVMGASGGVVEARTPQLDKDFGACGKMRLMPDQ